jgi:hypothetical protein
MAKKKKSAKRKNPRKRAKRSNPSSAPRSNPRRARKRARRRNPAAFAAPRSNPRRKRAKRRNPAARKTTRRRGRARRRNPSLPKFMTVAKTFVGGGLVYGASLLIDRIPNLSIYKMLAAQFAGNLLVAVGASMVSETVGAGAFGALGYRTPQMALQVWNQYQATKSTETKTGAQGIALRQMQGMRGVPMNAARAAATQMAF